MNEKKEEKRECALYDAQSEKKKTFLFKNQN